MHPAGINPAGKLLQGFCPMLNQCISAELNLYEAVITIIQVQTAMPTRERTGYMLFLWGVSENDSAVFIC